METDVVTGVPVPERITPEGVYDILEMTRDEVLIGETDPSTGKPIYETPVNYWMRVTWTGIGFMMQPGRLHLAERVIRTEQGLTAASICRWIRQQLCLE